jgi:hypothetical protein
MRILNKRGDGMTWPALLALVFFVILILLALTGSIPKIFESLGIISKTSDCGVASFGNGTCRQTCEPEETVKIQLSNCKDDSGKQIWCCINPDQ